MYEIDENKRPQKITTRTVFDEKRENIVQKENFTESNIESYAVGSHKKEEGTFLFNRQEEMKVKTKAITNNKLLFKCTYCRYSSRHYSKDEICPNCGRYNRLARIPVASEIVNDVKRGYFE